MAGNDSRLLKNSVGNGDGEWILCRRKEADVALFLQVTTGLKITAGQRTMSGLIADLTAIDFFFFEHVEASKGFFDFLYSFYVEQVGACAAQRCLMGFF